MFLLLRKMMNKKNFHQAKYKEISFHVSLFYYKKKHDAMNSFEYVIVNVVQLSKIYSCVSVRVKIKIKYQIN
jgi:hypothetical protein